MSVVDILKARARLRAKPQPITVKPEPITVDDVRQVFGVIDGPVVERSCKYCGDNPHARIVQSTWPDGRLTLICHSCGREWEAKPTRVTRTRAVRIHPLKAVEGKRGGVFCCNCYRPMSVSIVNGGYDWHCEKCAIVWRYRQ
jgi:hypothetical protein